MHVFVSTKIKFKLKDNFDVCEHLHIIVTTIVTFIAGDSRMKTNLKVTLNESEFRKIVKEELVRESIRRRLINEGYESEIVEEILQLDEFGLRDIKAAFKLAGGSAEKAKDIIAKKAGNLSAAAKEKVSGAIDSMAKKAGNVKSSVSSAFQEQYKKSFASDVDNVFNKLEQKYFNDRVLSKAGYDESDVEILKNKVKEIREEFSNFFQF